jgi:hypothetical protein
MFPPVSGIVNIRKGARDFLRSEALVVSLMYSITLAGISSYSLNSTIGLKFDNDDDIIFMIYWLERSM